MPLDISKLPRRYLEDARIGHFEPLAKHLENGGEVDALTRQFLAAYLRGEIKFPRGQRRMPAKVQQDIQFAIRVDAIMLWKRCNRSRAIKIFLDLNPTVNEETLKSALARVPPSFTGRVKVTK